MIPADALRDLWEAGLQDERGSPHLDHSEPYGEKVLATLMREFDIPIVTAPPKSVWIWSDLHLSDRVALPAWSRPFLKPRPARHRAATRRGAHASGRRGTVRHRAAACSDAYAATQTAADRDQRAHAPARHRAAERTTRQRQRGTHRLRPIQRSGSRRSTPTLVRERCYDPWVPEPDEPAQKYRDLLVEQTSRSQAEYDRLVIALSGGAFGISFTFVDRIAGPNPVLIRMMVIAWVFWALSLACALWSHRSSTLALRTATIQLDQGRLGSETTGGVADAVTDALNIASGALFVAGLLSVCLFTAANFGRSIVSNEDRQSPHVDIQPSVHHEERGARVPVAPPEVTQAPSGGSGAGSGTGSGSGSGGGSGGGSGADSTKTNP